MCLLSCQPACRTTNFRLPTSGRGGRPAAGRQTFLLLLLLGLAGKSAWAQASLSGQVVDAATRRPLGFVSVGVLRHPFGTVADERGRFTLSLPPPTYDADSVRFSLLGYAPRTVQVAALRRLVAAGPLLLTAQAVPLRAAQVRAKGLQRRVLGNQRGGMLWDFKSNMAGNQIGQRLHLRRPAFLEEVSFKLAFCSYDSVDLRLNVLRVQDDFPGPNVLPAPVYLRVGRRQLLDRVYVDLRRYKLYLTEDHVITLELVRSLPKGTLMFYGNWLGGPSYQLEQTPGPLDAKEVTPKGLVLMPVIVRFKNQPDSGPWVKYPGVGLGLDATILELPE